MASRNDDTIEDVTPKAKKSLKSYMTQGVFLVLMTAGVAGFVLGDMGQYMGGSSPSALATVGDKTVGLREADQMRQNIMAQLKGLPPELLGMQNPSAKAVEMLIEQYALSEYARSLNMRAPQPEVSRVLNQYQFFKDDITGKFSSEKLRLYLKRSGVSQEQFLGTIEDDILREIMFNALRSDIHIPSHMIEMHAKYQNEKREIQFASLDRSYFKNLPKLADDEKAQKEFFEKNKTNPIFLIPEMRHVEYVTFSKDTLPDLVPSQDVLKAHYTKNIQNYKTAETRKILQLFFETEEAAKKALPKLEKGKNFIPSAMDLGFEMENMDLGVITRVSLDETLTDEIFSVKQGEFTQPLSNGFGYVIYFSEEVTPSKTRPFETVKKDIQAELLQDAFKRFTNDNSDSLEDDIAGGMGFSEIAEKYNTKLVTLNNITGRGIDHMTQKAAIQNSDLLTSIFDAALDDEAFYVSLEDGGFIYGNVTKILPKTVMNFTQAKSLLGDLYQTQAFKSQITDVHKNITADIKKGMSFNALAKQYKLVTDMQSFGRQQSVAEMPLAMMSDLFDADENVILTSSFTENISDHFVIASVKAIQKSDPDADVLENVENEMRDNVRNNLYKALIKHAKNTVGVDINLDAYHRFLELNGQ